MVGVERGCAIGTIGHGDREVMIGTGPVTVL